MNLGGIFPSSEQIKLAQGIERELLQRKRTGSISGILAILLTVYQIILSIGTDYLKNLGEFFPM